MALAWEEVVNSFLVQSTTERREPKTVCDGHGAESDGFLRNSAAEMLLELADEYGTDVGTVIHGLVLWDRFVNSSNHAAGFQNALLASVACFIISAKLREVQHPQFRTWPT
jgi:hypothetical protein